MRGTAILWVSSWVAALGKPVLLIEKCLEVDVLGKRGPRAEKLAELFRLKYLKNMEDKELLKEALGVNADVLRVYENRLEKKLVTGLKQVSRDRLGLVCPECLEARVWIDRENGERVCTSCGFVVERVKSLSHRLPMDETYALENNIVFDRGSSVPIPRKHLHGIIAKSKNPEHKIQGIPIHQIVTMHTMQDPPFLQKMKEYAEGLRQMMDGKVADPDVFSNDLGRYVEKVGNMALLDPNLSHKPKALANACFVECAKSYGDAFKVRNVEANPSLCRIVQLIMQERITVDSEGKVRKGDGTKWLKKESMTSTT